MSHGIPRVSDTKPLSEEAKQLQKSKIDNYQSLVSEVNSRISNKLYNADTLNLTSKLLSQNPEFYTVWNYRRRVLTALFTNASASSSESSETSTETVSTLISSDLRYLIPLLQKFPKCYWLWNHRSWLLTQAENRLPKELAMSFWIDELGLDTKMLGRDSRNFHAWGYRRQITAELERLGTEDDKNNSLTEKEFEYTRSMIGKDLSNFSAWHARSGLLLKIAAEKNADDVERKKMLDQELDLIHEALIDPRDQSLWYYHQFLTLTFDSGAPTYSVAPGLPKEQRAQYLREEISYVKDILEGGEDIKWVYIALIELSTLYWRQSGEWASGAGSDEVSEWMSKLRDIDPMRTGRWQDWSQSLEVTGV